MRKVSLLAALTLAATLLAASPILAGVIPSSKTAMRNAVRSGEITPAQACQQTDAYIQKQNQQAIDVNDAVRSGEIAPAQACQQMVASASASATEPAQHQNAARQEPTGRVKTVSRPPKTGGSPLVSLAAGVLLIGGGLLTRWISR
jgi:hypothetical protein